MYIPTLENGDYRLEREFDISLTSKKGNVTKQGAKRKNWKKRWFVLHDDTLSYYKSQNDSYPAGSVKIEVDSLVMFVDEFQIGKKNCFAIVTKNRNYYMVCDLEEEVSEWVYALRASVYYANLKKVYNDPRNFLRGDQAKRVEKKGVLKKQGGSFKSIKTRFFVLKDSALSYYKSEKEMEPIDSIDLKGTRVEATKNTKCGITLHTVGRQYFFLAESERDREEWIDAINNVTKMLNEGELIQKKSIAIHQLILNRIKEAKKEKANDILSEQVSPHSPMMWKSLSFHRCRNQFLEKTENVEKINNEGIANPVDRLRKLYQEGKLSKLSSVHDDSGDMSASNRVSLMFPEGMKNLTSHAQDMDLSSQNMRVSLFAHASPMQISTSPGSAIISPPNSQSPNGGTTTPGSSNSLSSYMGSSSDVKIQDIKLSDKEKKTKKIKKDKLMIEHEASNDDDHAMEIMIKDSFSVSRTTNQVRESDDLDDLDDLINRTENIKLNYETESGTDDETDSSSDGKGEFTSVSLNTPSDNRKSNSSRRIIESDSDNSDSEISLNTTTVKPNSSNNSTVNSGKIILKDHHSDSDSDSEQDDEEELVGATFSVKPTISLQQSTNSVSLNSPGSNLSTPSTKIKTRISKTSDKTKRVKKNQSTFRRMHRLVEGQLETLGIEIE